MTAVRKFDRPATLADLQALPSHLRGEIIAGMLYTFFNLTESATLNRMSTARKLLTEVLQLDETQRAALALALMDSLSPSDPRDDASWVEEIERRARRVLSGKEPGIDLDDALDRISRDLGL